MGTKKFYVYDINSELNYKKQKDGLWATRFINQEGNSPDL